MQPKSNAAIRYGISRRFSAALKTFTEEEVRSLDGLYKRDFRNFLRGTLNPDTRRTMTIEVDSGGQPIGWQKSPDSDMTK